MHRHPLAGSVDSREALPHTTLELPIPLCAHCAPAYRLAPYPRRALLSLVLFSVALAFSFPLIEHHLPAVVSALVDVAPWVVCMFLIGLYWVMRERRADRAFRLHPSHERLRAAGYGCRYEVATDLPVGLSRRGKSSRNRRGRAHSAP